MLNRMVERQSLDATFGALADPSRRAILRDLRLGQQRVTDLARPFPVSLNAISKHIKVLERAGLVHRSVIGRDHYLELVADPLQEAVGWIELYRDFWEPRLDALEAMLRASQ
jgi:DNA-binding transcriptional ArsR family regulator